jgi:hypothetical protein
MLQVQNSRVLWNGLPETRLEESQESLRTIGEPESGWWPGLVLGTEQ